MGVPLRLDDLLIQPSFAEDVLDLRAKVLEKEPQALLKQCTSVAAQEGTKGRADTGNRLYGRPEGRIGFVEILKPPEGAWTVAGHSSSRITVTPSAFGSFVMIAGGDRSA